MSVHCFYIPGNQFHLANHEAVQIFCIFFPFWWNTYSCILSWWHIVLAQLAKSMMGHVVTFVLGQVVTCLTWYNLPHNCYNLPLSTLMLCRCIILSKFLWNSISPIIRHALYFTSGTTVTINIYWIRWDYREWQQRAIFIIHPLQDGRIMLWHCPSACLSLCPSACANTHFLHYNTKSFTHIKLKPGI